MVQEFISASLFLPGYFFCLSLFKISLCTHIFMSNYLKNLNSDEVKINLCGMKDSESSAV